MRNGPSVLPIGKPGWESSSEVLLCSGRMPLSRQAGHKPDDEVERMLAPQVGQATEAFTIRT